MRAQGVTLIGSVTAHLVCMEYSSKLCRRSLVNTCMNVWVTNVLSIFEPVVSATLWYMYVLKAHMEEALLVE